MRKNTLFIYLFVVAALISVIAITLSGHPGIGAGVVAGIGSVSIITSLAPFFVSRYLFKKGEPFTHYRKRYRIWGMILYVFCFPVKLWAIYVLIYLLVHGEPRWAFG